MRYRDLLENVWPEDIIRSLQDYQEYVDYDAVWSDKRHGWQDRLIQFMAEHPELQPRLPGMLYRATNTSDETARLLREGRPARHTTGESKLESWSKLARGASQYMSGIEDTSAVLMMIPASKLHVIVDLDAIPYPKDYDEHEVLVLAEDRLLKPNEVLALVWNDYDGTREHHRGIAPDLAHDLDYHTFEERLAKL